MSEQNGTSLAVREPTHAPAIKPLEWNQAQIELLSKTLVADAKLTGDELRLFIAVCKRTQLDPFLRQVFAIKSGGRLLIHVGIDGRRAVAHRTGLVAGTDGPYWCGEDGVWTDVWLSDTPPAAAKFSVYRKGAPHPFTGVVRMASFRGTTPIWREKPDHMLAIRAEDHAWRKAFPYEMGGLPTYHPEQGPDANAAEAIAEAQREAAALQTPARQQRAAPRPAAAAQQAPPAQEPAEGEYTEAVEDEGGPSARPGWWETDLGREVSGVVDELDAADAKYSVPDDDASEADLRGWLEARRSWLNQRAQVKQPAGAK